MLNAELKVTSGKQAGNVIPLAAGRFLIGREEDCHLRPSNDLVSRHHCVFKTDDYTVRVRDLGSTNGTFVNGERLRGEVMLNTGDQVRVGTLEFEVTVNEGEAAATEESVAEAAAAINEDRAPDDASQTMVGAAPVADEPQEAALQETASFQATGDTVYQAPQQQPFDPNQQQGYPQQAPIGYQMPYPQQNPYMYGQPYGMPMGYPQQPMPYPQMGYPQQPMPQQQAPPPAVEPEPAETSSKQASQGVNLPDPSQTGAKAPEPSAPKGEEGAKEVPVSDQVGDIIKQYTQRRPGGTK